MDATQDSPAPVNPVVARDIALTGIKDQMAALWKAKDVDGAMALVAGLERDDVATVMHKLIGRTGYGFGSKKAMVAWLDTQLRLPDPTAWMDEDLARLAAGSSDHRYLRKADG